MINIIQGSIFDAKCDLLVIPCNEGGGVASSVQSSLREHGLPIEIGPIPLGEVHFRDVVYENALMIAYAASVGLDMPGSNKDVVMSIGRSLTSFAASNGILSINLPLLGSGAGGLSHLESYRALEVSLGGADRHQFNVYCFTADVYRDVIGAGSNRAKVPAKPKNPRVLISYAQANKNNALWVRSLAEKLRAHGVNARLDAFHLRAGADLPQWMTNEIIQADKVVLVCDRNYMEKADFRKGGVGWETMIIQGDMLAQGDSKTKYIAIAREDKVNQALPIYMRSKMAFAWGMESAIDEAQFKDLLICLFDCDEEPPLGEIPGYIAERLAR